MFIYLQTKRKVDMISNKRIKLCSPSACKINITNRKIFGAKEEHFPFIESICFARKTLISRPTDLTGFSIDSFPDSEV